VHGESERRPFVHRAPHKPSHTDADGTNDRALTAVDTRDENVMAKFSGSVPCVNCRQAAGYPPAVPDGSRRACRTVARANANGINTQVRS